MRRTISGRLLAVLMALAILLTMFAGLSAYATAPSATSIGKNTAKRHELCTALSDAAKAYYPAGSTYSDLIQLPGVKTNNSTEAIGSPLFNKLKSMMQPKDTISYSSLNSYWKYTDASEGSSDACLFYSDEISSSYNREHVWPKSRGNFYQSGAGSDIQHLRPTNSTINSTRGNMTMGNVREKTGYTVKTKDYNGKTVLWYISNYTDNDCQGLVEIADNIKGDVARIYLYVYTTYGAENANKNLFTKCGSYGVSSNDGNKVIESLDTLLEWCAMDPVDEWEMMRNDLCQKVQGNRNIFIDYPELGWYLFGREDEIPGDMQTPSGMASGTTPSSYVITAVSNNNDWGTVQLTGKIIDAAPAEGYYAAGCEVTEGEAAVSQNGNRFSVSPKSDCTVQINFAPKATCYITCMNADGSYTNIFAYTGEETTLPTQAVEVDGWRFIGWVEEAITENSETRPAYYAPGAAYTPSGNKTFYALYSMVDDGSTGETDSYQLLKETPANIEGNYVLTNENAEYVLLCDDTQPVGQYKAAILLKDTGMTKDGDTLLDVTDTFTLVCEHVSGNKYTFRLKGAENAVYLMTTDANGGFSTTADRENPEAQWTVSINSNSAVISNASYTSRTIQFNGNQNMFRTYTQGQQPVFLWKALEGGKVYYSTAPVSVAHEHACVLVEANDPSCTEDGNTAYLCCSICGKYFSLEQYDETGELVEITKDSVLIPALNHAWGEASYLWSEDFSEVTASHTCTRNESHVETETVKTSSEVTKEATAEEEGEITYTAQFTKAGFETQTNTVKTEKLAPTDPCANGHDWGEPNYEWRQDLSEVTAIHVCKNNSSHVETETVQTSSEVTKEATVDAEGEITYTAVFKNTAFETQTKTETTPKLDNPDDPQPTEKLFVDVNDGDWFKDAVLWAVSQSPAITSGTDKTHFSPNKTCTRAEVVQFLWNAAGQPDASSSKSVILSEAKNLTDSSSQAPQNDMRGSANPFVDVKESDWYYNAVLWAVANGITSGTDSTHFSPAKKCTRAEVVTFLRNAAGKPPVGVGEVEVPHNPFDDVAEEDWYFISVIWAVQNGITAGTTPTTFSPGKTCTRAEVVQFLYNAS